MKSKAEKSKPAVSPGFIIVMGIIVIAVLGYVYLSPSQPNAPLGKPGTLNSQATQSSIPSGKTKVNQKAGQTAVNSETREFKSGRDPFDLPAIFVRSWKNSGSTVKSYTSASKIDLWSDKVKIPSCDYGSTPTLHGIISTDKDTLALVYLKNKSYLLRPGDSIPGTKYRLTTIGKKVALFNSPVGQLRLGNKEGSKNK